MYDTLYVCMPTPHNTWLLPSVQVSSIEASPRALAQLRALFAAAGQKSSSQHDVTNACDYFTLLKSRKAYLVSYHWAQKRQEEGFVLTPSAIDSTSLNPRGGLPHRILSTSTTRARSASRPVPPAWASGCPSASEIHVATAAEICNSTALAGTQRHLAG